MAFLDNSGDIILDAVLTAVGRQKIANGSAIEITDFALGDDGIDYGLYDKTHPSGSAYYDLEILQTPILEAFTQINANINYGLLGALSNNILYMPVFARNSLQTPPMATRFASTISSGGASIFYVAANDQTAEALSNSTATTTSQVVFGTGTPDGPKITYETGLDTTDYAKTMTNRDNFILNSERGMNDTSVIISADGRFITGLIVPSTSSPYKNDSSNTAPTHPQNTDFALRSTSTPSQNLSNYRDFTGVAVYTNEIIAPTAPATAGSAANWSVIAGPGGMLVSFKPVVAGELTATLSATSTDQKYINYGSTSVPGSTLGLTGDTSTMKFDYLDTMIYLTGNVSGVSIGVPVRIIRRKS